MDRTDVLFARTKSDGYWLYGETPRGMKFVRRWFDRNPAYIQFEDLETYIARAQEENINVEVH